MKLPESLSKAQLGVLNDGQLLDAINVGFVENFELIKENGSYKGIDGSSLDLHLTNQAWKLTSTAKLTQEETVLKLIERQKGELIDLNEFTLKKGCIYVIRLRESLAFNKFKGRHGFYGTASGRSSIGRLDILTRLIVDYSPKYDEVPPDYRGNLFLEVVPLSFDIIANAGVALNQLRIFIGKPELSELTNEELANAAPMIYIDKGKPVVSDLTFLRVNLNAATNFTKTKIIGFKAKAAVDDAIDLTKGTNSHDPNCFFEEELDNEESNGLKMDQERFYILRSVERMFLPNDVAVTCVAYTENLGELRIHYAGFAHPNFGRPKDDQESKITGAPLIFEARCHSFSVTIRKKEHFARIQYYRMSAPTDKASSYSDQELTLSGYFKKWRENGTD